MTTTPTILPTGYDPFERFFASRYTQGGRTVYSVDFSVRELVTFLPKPDPEKPLDVNSTQRRIVPKHAQEFADYLLERPEWVAPALLLRSPDIFEFNPYEAINTATTQFGILAVPKDAKSEIQIVDGQHRTLGFHLAWERLAVLIERARGSVAAAKRQEEPALIEHHQGILDEYLAVRDRLAQERVSVQIVLTDAVETARRIFIDINDNAKGITGSVRDRFNDRTAVGRALNVVLESSDLLEGRVDLEQDRVGGTSPYLLGAKHVADIIRALAVGNGRIGRVVAQSLNDSNLVKEFEEFEEALLTAFPSLNEVVDGDLSAGELRQQHLIASNVVMRAFAAAWHDLLKAGVGPAEITSAWKMFDDQMSLPVYANQGDSWFSLGVFEARTGGSYSTRSRAQDFKTLTKFIVDQTLAGDAAEWNRAAAEDRSLIPAR